MTTVVQLSFDVTTRILSVTSITTGNDIAGTSGDNNQLQLTVTTVNGSVAGYTGRMEFDVKLYDEATHKAYKPYILLTNGSCVVPYAIMEKAVNGNLPIQLVYTSETVRFTSTNIVRLTINPSIDALIEQAGSVPMIDNAVDTVAYANLILTVHHLNGHTDTYPIGQPTWGDIVGSISNQTDLMNLFATKVSLPSQPGSEGQILAKGTGDAIVWKDDAVREIVTSWGNPTSNEKVPSEKLVKDSLDGKVNAEENKRLMTDAEGTKLAGIASGAEINVIEGVKLSDSIEVITPENKIVTIPLVTTTADGIMSLEDKGKLDDIASGAEVNVQSDWSVTDTGSDAYILNKPAVPDDIYLQPYDMGDYFRSSLSLRSGEQSIGNTRYTDRLYKGTGQNNNGSMTQKAITDALGNKQDARTVLNNINGVMENDDGNNPLASKSFVNSSIATETAYFRGTYPYLKKGEGQSENGLLDIAWQDSDPTATGTYVTNNDYAFAIGVDAYGNTAYNRYKWTHGETRVIEGVTTSWLFEYALNNSSFTQAQWSAINSGITGAKVDNYDSHIGNTSNPHSVTKAQVGLGNVANVETDSVITQGSDNNITSGAVYTALQGKQDAFTFTTAYLG